MGISSSYCIDFSFDDEDCLSYKNIVISKLFTFQFGSFTLVYIKSKQILLWYAEFPISSQENIVLSTNITINKMNIDCYVNFSQKDFLNIIDIPYQDKSIPINKITIRFKFNTPITNELDYQNPNIKSIQVTTIKDIKYSSYLEEEKIIEIYKDITPQSIIDSNQNLLPFLVFPGHNTFYPIEYDFNLNKLPICTHNLILLFLPAQEGHNQQLFFGNNLFIGSFNYNTFKNTLGKIFSVDGPENKAFVNLIQKKSTISTNGESYKFDINSQFKDYYNFIKKNDNTIIYADNKPIYPKQHQTVSNLVGKQLQIYENDEKIDQFKLIDTKLINIDYNGKIFKIYYHVDDTYSDLLNRINILSNYKILVIKDTTTGKVIDINDTIQYESIQVS